MKMKRYLYLLLFVIGGWVPLQAQTINSLKVIPANPTPQDTVLLLASCTFSSMGCDAWTMTTSVVGNVISTYAMHCLGMATAMCDDTDTIKLDPLPLGTYQFIYHVDAGFGGPPCTPGIVPGPTDTLVFVVDSAGTNCPLPAAGFGFSTSGMSVSFADSSQTTGAVQYYWVFGDGSGSSALPSPVYTYNSPGTYYVCLVVTDSCGIDTACQTIVISSVCPPPIAGFGFNASGLSVSFADSSQTTGAVQYYWVFGDSAGSSALPSPVYTYNSPGTYYVCLVVTDSCGIDTACQTIVISSGCTPPIAGFTHTANWLNVDFSDASIITGAVTYSWDFGDGGSSVLSSPAHAYANTGAYLVCLVITDSCGTDSVCDSLSVLEEPTSIGVDYAGMPSFELFPNPAANELNYSITGSSFRANSRFIVYSIKGEMLGSYLVKEKKGMLTIDVENGIYLCFYKSDRKISFPVKLIIHK
jgi:PKD repeat protein